jgi:uroporphyrinogen decarboxylase
MRPIERVMAALSHQTVDRVPRCEIWIDALLEDLGQDSLEDAHVNLGQDSIMLFSEGPKESNAWRNGVDEWGRVWKNGMYTNGVVKSRADLKHYTMPLAYSERFFDPARSKFYKARYPDHCLMYGSHLGPFMAAYMAMGFENFFMGIMDTPSFIIEIIENRSEWAIAMFKKAVSLGAQFIVMGEDAAHKSATMVSPSMWRKNVLPFHKQIVASIEAPMIFHSDGNILPFIPMIIEAGFVGLHGLEPAAGIDLAVVKREYGKDLVLIGNVDVRSLAGSDVKELHQEIDRCMAQGSPGGGYMISSCNSIFTGLNPVMVKEFFDYEMKVSG